MKKKFLIPLLLISTAVYGADDASQDLFALTLEDLMIIKVSGATLTEQSLKTVPSSVTVFNHEQIAHLGMTNLYELMNLVPGFQSFRSSYSPQLSSFSARGRTIGGLGAEVLLIIDGQRIDEPRTSGSVIIGGSIPLMNIERVEFIRGPGSAVYGSNAMLGVINIVTRREVNEVALEAGSFNHHQAHVMHSSQVKNVHIDSFVQYQKDDGDDYNVPDSFTSSRIDTSDPMESANINLNISWPNHHINIQHYQTQASDFYMFGLVANDINETESRFSSMAYKHNFNWSSIASWIQFSVHQSRYYASGKLAAEGSFSGFSTPDSNDALFSQVDFDDYQEQHIQWHNDWKLSQQSSAQFGIDARHLMAPEVVAKNNFDLADIANSNFPIRYYGELLATTPLQKKSQRDILGAYGQYQHAMTPETQLTLGARFDHFSSIGERISPRLGLVHQLNPQQTIKLLYGEAFRAPAENELNLLNNTVILGDPDLKSEVVKSWEAIYLFQEQHIHASASYFENHFEDAIQRTLVSGNVFQFSNIDQDPVKGLEIEVNYEFNDHWLMSSSYTYFTDKPSSSFREAEQLASLTLNYQHAYWNANIAGHYIGKHQMSTGGSDENLINLDAYWKVYGKLIYQFQRHLKGYVQVKNLLDETVLSPPYNADQTEGIPNRGRSVLIGISWEF